MITAGEGADVIAALASERARILDQLTQHTEQTLREVQGLLAETSDYALSSAGKLLRPLLVLEACRAAGGDPEVVFPAAAGTEYGHVASLIHDDIIDGDRERRGQTTLHVKYDLPTAILTGDFLIFEMFLNYTRCFERGASAEAVLAAMRTLSATCVDMCRGQALEAALAGHLETTEQTYRELIFLKTASVCRAATRIGALLSDAPDDAVEALSNYGDNLGMAFQIIDDILSFEGHPAIIGKPVKSDSRNRRVTLPVIYALQAGDTFVRQQIHALYQADDADGRDIHAELASLLASTHALEQARAVAHRYTTAAKSCLMLLPYSESRERLHALADIFLMRDH